MSAALALLLQTAQPAPPPPPLHGGPQDMVCPLGGEHFAAWQPTMYGTFGERPDGKPYSYLPFPLPIPECPSNKLVMFDRFDAREVALLAPLIATPDYRRLVDAETSYFLAWWLAGKLGRSRAEALGFLLPAIWQVSGGDMTPPADAARARRYQLLFIAEVDALSGADDPARRLGLTARAANAARQLGTFDRAEALRRRAVRLLAMVPDPSDWRRYLDRLAPVIARHDASLEPLDMIPDQQAKIICEDRPPESAFGKAHCARAATTGDASR